MTTAALPLGDQGRVSSPFGMRARPNGPDLHTGVDIAAPEGTPVFAVLPGKVRVAAKSGELSGYGNVVVLEHTASLFSLYAHLQGFHVQVGDQVALGAPLGTVGRTAGTKEDPAKMFVESGAHLHLEFLDRWPPRGKDLDRLNPANVLALFGVVVPTQGRLVHGLDIDPPASTLPSSSSAASSSSSAAGVVLLGMVLLGGLVLAARRR